MSVCIKGLTLFSSIRGIVVLEGDCVKEVKLTRKIEWQDEIYVESAFTDDEGKFNFDVVTQDSFFWRFSPHDPSIKQCVEILHEGKRRTVWEYNKKNYDLDQENSLQPLTLYCDLGVIK